jgi:hypothetical protein
MLLDYGINVVVILHCGCLNLIPRVREVAYRSLNKGIVQPAFGERVVLMNVDYQYAFHGFDPSDFSIGGIVLS